MATPPGINTWAAGSILTAAQLNTYLSQAIGFLTAPPYAQLRQTVAQSAGTSNQGVPLLFDAEDADTDGGHSTVTNTSRYTSNTAGWYDVDGGVGITGGTHTRVGTYWSVNGTLVNGCQALASTAGITGIMCTARGMSVFLNVGDYLEEQWLATYSAGTPTTASATAGQSQATMTVQWRHS